uniref:Neural cell adhesion molecule L1.1 n=1 Tax=Cynoglossus semilaevis TaxID=244447 RepID=A0A3P8UED9_CYNSE
EMCASQHRRTGYRGRCCPALLLLLPFFLLSSPPPFAQGAIQIPEGLSQPPVLTEMPSSFTAFSAEDLILPCEATGNPTPIFRWVKDGAEFGEELQGSGTFKAEKESVLDFYEGVYRCYASNILGTAMTDVVRVIVEPQPVLLKQQKIHKRAFEGESIVLTCNPPESSTPPNIHWMDISMVHIEQNERVLVGLDGNLFFANLLKSDSKQDYICNAQYVAARTILPEAAIALTVQPSNDVNRSRKPLFLSPSGTHSMVHALRGQTVTLECIPKGLPTPEVEWKKSDGSLQETGGDVKKWGPAPYWVKEPQNLMYSPGETVRLECQAEGIPTPAITWSINGQPITDVDEDARRSVSGGVLKLRDVVFADTAVYQCEATNKHGTALRNTFLYVIELPPQILSSDAVVYKVAEGKDVKMHCESFGSPRPHVAWWENGSFPLLSDLRVSLLTNGTIELLNVNHEDSGTYTCSIKHTNMSITAHLEVFNRTLILTPPQEVRCPRESSALLDCHFYKDPRLQHQVVWKMNGFKLLSLQTKTGYNVFPNGTLKVENVQSEDTGVYSCEVITDLDNAQASGFITVVAPPDPPKDLSLYDLEDDSLTLSWIPGQSHNSPILEFIVEAREEQHTEEGKWRWEEWKRVPGDVNHSKLKLRPFCTYRFRIVAVNEIGRSKPSRESDFHATPPAVPDMNPTGVRSDSKEPKALIITWDEMDKHFHNGQDFQYKVSWRQAGGQDSRWETRYVTGPPFLVNDTGTYTPFEIKVQAVNSLGEGPDPIVDIGHSGEDKPEEAPEGVHTTVMNSTVRVKWNEAQNVRGKLLGYKIYLKRLGPQTPRGRRSLGKSHHSKERAERAGRGLETIEERRVVVVHGHKTSEEVSELRLFSRYELSVTAFNSKGEGPHSQPHHFSTPEGAPGPPASLTFDSKTEKSLDVFWSPPLETNGILLGYMIQYQQGDNESLKMEFISDPNVTHHPLGPLEPGIHYSISVIARTASGDGPPIQGRSATLLDGVPPTNITVIQGSTFLNLSWVPGDRHRNLGFHIQFLRKSGEWKETEQLNSTQGYFSLTGLQPGTEYHLRILNGNDTQWEEVAQTDGPVPSEITDGFATRGWLIGLISAILLLLLILLILCLIKRSRGGKYAVKDKEDKEVDSEARPMKDETFGEYSDGDEKHSDSQPSLCGESKLGSDDSLAEYGDSVDIQFNEDGSFIGQYSGRGPVPHGHESSDNMADGAMHHG